MASNTFPPVHPGVTLEEDFLRPLERAELAWRWTCTFRRRGESPSELDATVSHTLSRGKSRAAQFYGGQRSSVVSAVAASLSDPRFDAVWPCFTLSLSLPSNSRIPTAA